MIKGCAAPDGTRRYCLRHGLPPAAVRICQGLILSAVGAGTYGHAYDETMGANQRKALMGLLRSGCNVIATAPNYFDGNAEKNAGIALAWCVEQGFVKRDEVFIATKAGLVPEAGISGDRCYDFDPGYLLRSLLRAT